MPSLATQSGSNPDNTFEVIVPGSNKQVPFTDTSAQSTAFSPGVSIARFFATQDCYLKFGADPTVTTEDLFLPAGIVEYFGVTAGQKVAAIRSSANGVLHITEGAA